MQSVYHEWFHDYLISIYCSCFTAPSPYLARVDGVSIGYYSSLDVALQVAREHAYALLECSLLERG